MILSFIPWTGHQLRPGFPPDNMHGPTAPHGMAVDPRMSGAMGSPGEIILILS